ncbi:MAG: calcium/sodium antiporter [Planctomycetota bacterium]
MSPQSWFWIVGYLIVGFVLLSKGADWLVLGGASLARRLGVSALVVGLTVIACGTSAPEFVVSAFAAKQGHVELSLGNVLGSNVCNLALVLGGAAVILPGILQARLASREIFWTLFAVGFVWWLASDRALTRVEGSLCLLAFVGYNVQLAFSARVPVLAEDAAAEKAVRRSVFELIAGIVAISLGAKLVLDGAVAGAGILGMPESVVGLTVVALGTSLPEVAAGWKGAYHGHADISIGNVVGSNVFNLLGVLGLVAVLQPLDPSDPAIADPAGMVRAFDDALREDFFVVAGVTLLVLAITGLGRGRAGRLKGALLLSVYVGYNVWLVVSR